MFKAAPNIEHLELAVLEFADYGLKAILQEFKTLKFVDLTGVVGVTHALLEETKEKRPDLLLKNYKINLLDPKDNDLRVPRRVVEKEKKKKGKKK